MAIAIDPCYLGRVVSGDLDGITIYTNRRGRKVAFPKAPPLSPPSPLQRYQQGRWKLAMQGWRSLTNQQRLDYAKAVRMLSLCLVGNALWIGLCCRPTDNEWQTLCRQTQLPLAQPTKV